MTTDEPARSWLAVDGGQSALRVRHGHGNQRTESTAAGVVHSPDGTFPSLLTTLNQALDALPTPQADRVVLGLSGTPENDERRNILGTLLTERCAATSVLVCSDNVTAHAGAFAGQPGIAVTVGTGTNVLGMSPDGQFVRIDGRGYLLGDEGSAYAIGRDGIRAVFDASEGRGPATSLAAHLREHIGPLPQVTRTVYTSETPVNLIAQFAKFVATAAHGNDPVAHSILAHAAAQIARSTAAAAHQLGSTPLPVALVGPLAAAPPYAALIRQALAVTAAAGPLVTPMGGPLDGAEHLAQHGPGPYLSRMSRLI